jgi:hypothetical protein
VEGDGRIDTLDLLDRPLDRRGDPPEPSRSDAIYEAPDVTAQIAEPTSPTLRTKPRTWRL